MKTKGTEKWHVEYERDYKRYIVKKNGFQESNYYFRTEAVERAVELNEMDNILEGKI